MLSVALPSSAQENDDCLMCHEDRELTGSKHGREVSMHVDPVGFAASVHADFACIDCHSDLDGVELPHDEELEIVDCSMCHDDISEEMATGPHGGWAMDDDAPSASCQSCHGVHDVLSSKDPRSPTSHARSTELCSACHEAALSAIERSPHGRKAGGDVVAACIDCHSGHAVKSPADPIGQLGTCGPCHEQQVTQHRRSLHGRAAVRGDELAPSCVTCHQHHAIMSHEEPSSPTSTLNVPALCARCHREGSPVMLQHDIPQHHIISNFSMSVHGEGLFKKGLTVTAVCTSCHTAHDILDHNHPESTINRNNIAGMCMTCHARIEEVHVKVIEGRLWEEEPHKVPSCVECHQPHEIRNRPVELTEASTRACMECHSDPMLTTVRDGEEVSLFIDPSRFGITAHKRTACAQCHTDVSPRHPERACATITSPVDCSVCHAEQVQDHELSRHGQLTLEHDADAPQCLTCHGDPHAMLDHRVPSSPTFARNVPELCGTCHAAGMAAAERIESEIPDIVESYVLSAHGKGLLDSGLVVSASCVDCHSSHKALPKEDPNSTIHSDNLPDTCGTCHKGIEEQFRNSVHWPENVVTNEQLPTCEDCHTSHTITRTDAQGFRFEMMDQCGRCHHDYAETFFETYHGKVTQLGSEGAAKCYDCHGTHNILPTTNPDSTLSTRHVVETCATCHPRAHLQFAGYLSHATHHDPEKYPYLFYSFWFMTLLLMGTLTFFLLHTALWLFRLWRSREHWQPLKASLHKEEKFYLRFTAKQRTMHLVMLLSFFILALTGMALKFSFMGWAQGLSRLLGGYATMGLLHRIGAIVLLALFAYHLVDLVRSKAESGKGWLSFIFGPNSLMFNLRDLREFWASTKWFLGIGPRPQYGRFTYWEKFDYFAVFWGVFVIGSTGLLLWFPEFFTRFLPGWSVNVATIIHSDEALLAVGFIFTIHFFNTHFRPDKFPMDPVIFTGRVPLEELKHDKPDEYKEFVEDFDGEDNPRIVGPADAKKERVARIFGFTALFIGLTLIGLIVYTVLFGYR
jgi:predicted CXXCH cytochrome family protein